MALAFAWNIDREIVALGPLALRWYSLLFALGFVVGYLIVQRMFRAEGKSEDLLDSLLVHLVLGTVIGARLGHCLFYEPGEYLTDPIRILKIWEGGLASHGGFTGVTIAMILFARKYRDLGFYWVMDRVSIPTMMTAGFIRIGNFFNSEILGKQVDPDFPLAVIFEKVDQVPRHPTQLYESAGYFAVALILYAVYRAAGRKPLEGRIFGLAMILGYGFRFFIEQFKEVQVAFEESMTFNMGQLLSVPFVLLGFFFLFGWHRKVPLLRYGFSEESGLAPARAVSPAPTDDGPASGPASRKGQLRKQTKKLKG